ncbi:MAG: hypothetical protein JEZ09_12160 [Salinivirgaceae bacterium]|nr:hypothetical protein [Salinivirgaceae bacterium]
MNIEAFIAKILGVIIMLVLAWLSYKFRFRNWYQFPIVNAKKLMFYELKAFMQKMIKRDKVSQIEALNEYYREERRILIYHTIMHIIFGLMCFKWMQKG